MARACNPVTQEAEAGEPLEVGAEVAASQVRATVLQPGRQSETPSQKNKKEKNRKKIRSIKHCSAEPTPTLSGHITDTAAPSSGWALAAGHWPRLESPQRRSP